MSKKAQSVHELIDFPAFYPEGEDSDGERKLRCFNPKHNDKKPSMTVNLQTGQFHCFGCGYKGNAIVYARDILGWSYEELAKRVGLKKWIDPADVRRYHEALLRNDVHMRFLLDERGLTRAVIDRFVLGLDGARIVIPVVEEGEVVNLRRYLPHAKEGTDKMRNESGFGAVRLWPLSVVADSERIVVVEGELDALCCLSHDVPACTGTGGASVWKPEWSPLFSGKSVAVCYDVDEPGQRGAQAVLKSLKPYVAELRNVQLPLDARDFPHGDVTDYFVNQNYDGRDLLNLIDASPVLVQTATPPAATEPKKVEKRSVELSAKVFDVALGSASKAQYYNQRVKSEVLVSAKDTAPYFVPKKCQVTCAMGQKICALCPVSAGQGEYAFELLNDDPLLLQLINRTDDQQKGALRKYVGIPRACTAHQINRLESWNIEEVRLVPQFVEALDADKRQEYVVRRCFYVGHGIETNAPFEIEAVTVPEPTTQYATHLIYRARAAVDNLTDFRLTPQDFELLTRSAQARGVPSPTAAAIELALKARYDDLEANVTRVWGRRQAHLLVDIVYHSLLQMEFSGVVHKGYLEALLIGDSGQGKSAVTAALQRHYGCGERTDVGAATVAGLKGGLQETQKRWWVTWGVVPQNDRRLVILEEVKNANPEVLAKLRDMRSSGIAEVAGIERQRTNARTRLLWVSNPRGQRQIGSYDYGVLAVLELLGHLEDVRRFDLAAMLASGDVDSALINRPQEAWPVVEHTRTAQFCRTLVLWAWSRTARQVQFSTATTKAVLERATKQGADYHASIPLVEPADQRLKLARTAAAFAALTFNTTDGENLIVAPAHVEIADRFMRSCYDTPAMAYDRYSRQQYLEDSIADPDQVLEALRTTTHPWDLVAGLLQSDYLGKGDVADFIGATKTEDTNELVGLLVRKRALKKYNTRYRKTPAFINWLRSLKREDVEGRSVSKVAEFSY